MKISGEYTFDADPEAVWKGLMDPEVLAATMPGCEKLELVGENQYEGELNIKIGPVQGKFRGRIELENIEAPNSYDLKVDGQGAQGFVKATVHVAIEAVEDKTRMTYEGDSQVGGRIASVGQRLMDSSAKAIIRQSLAGLNEVISGASAGEGDDAEAPAQVAAPSQAAFAANIAKEVARDLVPKPVWIALLVLVALVITYLIMR
ncbi:MAG: carbon monoxide dehydrogenase subunit G [Acidobacteria bacterium]|nr:carbon monoxide dehydrogenase subunit G [Acidobacteriota bacterium]